MQGYEFQEFHMFGMWPFLIWMALFALPFAIGNYFLAGRMGKSQALWVILTIIPFVNYVFFIYVAYTVVLYVLDRLNQSAPPSAHSSSPA